MSTNTDHRPLVLVLATALLAGCHATAPLATPTPDLGPAPSGFADMGPPPDMPSATTRIAGDFVTLSGLTTDGWAVVVDAAHTAWAIGLADQSRHKIADAVGDAFIYRDTVFVSSDVGSDGIGRLLMWRAGQATTLSDASPAASFGFSPPVAGAGQLAYYTNASGTKADLVVGDGASAHTVLSGVDLASTSVCWPTMRFSDGRLLVAHCDDAGTSWAITSYDPSSGTGVDLLAPAQRSFAAHAGVGVLVLSPTGQASIVAAAGGTPRPLADGVTHARLTFDGSAALVVTSAGALERVAISDGTATVLEASGVVSIEGLSRDGSFLSYSTMLDPDSGLNDLYLASATHTGAATPLDSATTSTPLGFDFSDDAGWVLYVTDVDANTFAGSLHARPVAGGADRTLGPTAYGVVPAGGARVVFADHYSDAMSGRADIELVDLAHDTAPTKLATQAYAFFDVSADDHTVAWVQPGDGLYLRALP